ncbi:MAG: type II toxin-antitoxin system HicA family toxin [Vicinamibacteria bacterium]|nr:type II toxin-antitoxin system HicA family toxin [Vicinamibacteria bacterium]
MPRAGRCKTTTASARRSSGSSRCGRSRSKAGAAGGRRTITRPTSKRVVTVAVHTKKDVGKGLAHRILKDAGDMTQHFPIVIEREANRSVSAWVVGLPGVYAQMSWCCAATRRHGGRHARGSLAWARCSGA